MFCFLKLEHGFFSGRLTTANSYKKLLNNFYIFVIYLKC